MTCFHVVFIVIVATFLCICEFHKVGRGESDIVIAGPLVVIVQNKNV